MNKNRRIALLLAVLFCLSAVTFVAVAKYIKDIPFTGNVTFKNGNPYPSWCFDTANDTLGTMEYAELAKTLSGAAAAGSGLPG